MANSKSVPKAASFDCLSRKDSVIIGTPAMQNRIPIMTILRGADAALRAIKSLQGSEVQVRALQEYHVPQTS
jgi:hypothetical protein